MNHKLDQEIIILSAKKIKEDFWSLDQLPFPDQKLQTFYEKNEDKWLANAYSLRQQFPVETNFFLANIYRSSFSFKLIGDRLNLFDLKKRFTISDKIEVLKNAFENSYYHFSFLAICANYSPEFVGSMYLDWFIPNKAKEFINNDRQNPWKINNNKVSGKKWALKNCPIFDLMPVPLDYLSIIKNADSHQKLITTNDSIIILKDKGEHLTLDFKILNKLYRYVRNAIFLALTFNMTLIIKRNFWITPALILTSPDRFDYRKVNLPSYQQLGNSIKNGNKKKHRRFIGDGVCIMRVFIQGYVERSKKREGQYQHVSIRI